MKFNINEIEWEIKEVEQEDIIKEYKEDYPKDDTYGSYIYGRTYYTKNIIKISKELPESLKKKTLKHELCHCWMQNTGNNEYGKYDRENICEIVANSNNFINEIIDRYFPKPKIEITRDGINIHGQIIMSKDLVEDNKDYKLEKNNT